jgi:hypothetical protein
MLCYGLNGSMIMMMMCEVECVSRELKQLAVLSCGMLAGLPEVAAEAAAS